MPDIINTTNRERREIAADILADALYQLILQGRGPRRPKDSRPADARPAAPPLDAAPGRRLEPEAA